MISKDVFSVIIRELQNYFKIELRQFALDIWLEALTESGITDEELLQATKSAIAQLTFLPSPEWLVSVIKGDENTLANSEWQKVVSASSTYADEPLIISLRGTRALELIGGLQVVRECDVSFLDTKRKSFVEIWKAKDPGVESLNNIRLGSLKQLKSPQTEIQKLVASKLALPFFTGFSEKKHQELANEFLEIGENKFIEKYSELYYKEWVGCLNSYYKPLFNQVTGSEKQ